MPRIGGMRYAQTSDTLISLDGHIRQPLAGPLVLGHGNAETGDPYGDAW